MVCKSSAKVTSAATVEVHLRSAAPSRPSSTQRCPFCTGLSGRQVESLADKLLTLADSTGRSDSTSHLPHGPALQRS